MLLHARNHYTQSLQLQPEPRYSSVQQALTRPRAARGLSASSDSKFFQHRFQIASFAAARCEGDMVQLLPCTIMRSKSLVNYCLVPQWYKAVVVPYHPHSGEPVCLCANRQPKRCMADDWRTIRSTTFLANFICKRHQIVGPKNCVLMNCPLGESVWR